MTEVIAQDAAEAEFDRFSESMDLDLDISEMDAEDSTAFKKQKKRIIKSIMNGSLIVNDNGEAVFTPSNTRSKHKEPFTFRERTGASLMAMDTKKNNHNVAKTYAVMADMCEVSPKVFSGLAGSDIKICEAIFALLMD